MSSSSLITSPTTIPRSCFFISPFLPVTIYTFLGCPGKPSKSSCIGRRKEDNWRFLESQAGRVRYIQFPHMLVTDTTNSLLSPLLRLFVSLPPTSPNPITAPLTHAIHALIGIPITPSLRNIWFPPTLVSRSSTNTPKSSAPQTPRSDNRPESRSGSPVPQTPTSTKQSTLDRALSVIAAGRRSLSRSSSPQVSSHVDVLQRAWDLLETAFDHFLAGCADPDDLQVRERIKKESPDNSLDDLLSPLVVLVTRLCMGDETSRARLKQWLVPDDLDRSSPLEQRSDMLGKCLRLLASVYHARLKDSIGEMLYAMAGSDGKTTE